MVTDDQILNAYKMISSLEGIFCEPASAASVAGVIKLTQKGYFKGDETVVCTLTGHGLKDPDIAIKVSKSPVRLPPSTEAILKLLKI